jgi:hypothetical protein
MQGLVLVHSRRCWYLSKTAIDSQVAWLSDCGFWLREPVIHTAPMWMIRGR